MILTDELHTYMVQRHTMRVGSPLTFSDGERVVAVLSSSYAGSYQGQTDINVTVLVELPQPPVAVAADLIKIGPKERPLRSGLAGGRAAGRDAGLWAAGSNPSDKRGER